MKKFLSNNFVAGLVFGLVFFLGPSLIGQGGLVGFDLLANLFGSSNYIVIFTAYLLFFSVAFFIYSRLTRGERGKFSLSSWLVFLAGVVVGFIAFVVVGTWAISNLSF